MMGDPRLVDLIQQQVLEAVAPHVDRAARVDLDALVGGSIRQAVETFRSLPGTRAMYAGTLGSFILEQNPYGEFEAMEFPDFPAEPAEENPWVRKSGVLAAHDASNPLPGTEPIPAGQVVHFTYSDWQHLAEDVEPLPEFAPKDINFGENGLPMIPPGFLRPPATVPRPADALPPDSSTTTHHSVVKMVRIRYSFFDRRYRPDSALAKEQYGRDRHTGYILVCYSGGDHG